MATNDSNQMTAFPRGFVALLLLVTSLLVVLLSGCDRQRYTDEDAQATLELGTTMAGEWVASNMPEAEVTSIANRFFSYPSGPVHLTDYVEGTLSLPDGSSRRFSLNVASGEMYLDYPEDALNDAVRTYLSALLGMSDENSFEQLHASLLVPYRVEGSSLKGSTPVKELELYMVPADVVNLDEFVRNATNRYRITVHAIADVGDLSLSQWDLAALQSLCEQANLRFFSLYLTNAHEVVECLDDESYYEHWDWYEVGPFRLWAQDVCVNESIGKSGIESDTKRVDPTTDLSVGELPNGYSLTYEGTRFSYIPYVSDGSQLLEHDWTMHDEDGDVDVRWVNAEDGLWILESVGGNTCYTYQDSTLTIR